MKPFFLFLSICIAILSQPAKLDADELQLNELFTNNMVLQRDKPIQIWGKASPNERITVTIDGNNKNTTTGPGGRWMVRLAPMPAGGPYILTVSDGAGKKIECKNVMTGDVWLCSGQSNMQLQVSKAKDSAQEIAGADMPQIRLYTVKLSTGCWPRESLTGKWSLCSPETVGDFSAARPGSCHWAWEDVRESQALCVDDLPNMGLVVTIDLDEASELHPRNKRPVGHRLSLAARAIAYREKLPYQGPSFKAMKITDGTIRLSFNHIYGGLVLKKGEAQTAFAVSGENREFVWAQAKLVGNEVVVKCDKVRAPVAVRYAWDNNPGSCYLYNSEGLPAIPFRTDNWPGKTFKRR